ncbi:hypothetical protein, partial [Herbaspirillum sp. B65]|uniref:hypothetical protein n=1 Tax=Herbaspirillum sp. B65 TaxID=137708 RepID=UPI001C26182C
MGLEVHDHHLSRYEIESLEISCIQVKRSIIRALHDFYFHCPFSCQIQINPPLPTSVASKQISPSSKLVNKRQIL